MKTGGDNPKILFVLYQFPPSNDVGAQRPVRFIRHLHHSGWKVFVLAPANGVYHSYDPQTAEEIQRHCRVVRVPMWFPHRRHRRLEAGPLVSLSWRAWNRLAMPDGALAWLPAAAAAGIRTIRRHRIPVVVASGQPFTTFLAAALIRRHSGAEVILDYRDLWSLNPFYKGSRLRRSLESQLEKFALRSASTAVFVTEECRRIQTRGFGESRRYRTITNAYEPIAERQNVGPQHRFRLIYAGNFYGSRTPWVFLRGLTDAAARNSALARDTRVEFYGVFDRRRLRRYCENHGLGSMVSLYSRIPRSELFRKMQQAGMLLLINSYGPGHEMFLPAKFFDYLAAARPILCLAEDGAVKRAVNQTGAGMVVDPRDTDAVSAALLQLYRDFHQRKLAFRIDPQKTMRFRASQTGRQFAELCRQSIAASGRRR